jgi:hypothetical protein
MWPFKEKLEFSLSFAKRAGVFQVGTIGITKPRDPKMAQVMEDVLRGGFQAIELDKMLTVKASPMAVSGKRLEVMVTVVFGDRVHEHERDRVLADAFEPFQRIMRDYLADGGAKLKPFVKG